MTDKDILILHLKWLTIYHSELLKIEQPGMPLEAQQKTRHLRSFVPHHAALHASLLQDALISGLYSVFERSGWDQKTRNSQKITLEHFVQQQPEGTLKERGQNILNEVRASPQYGQLCQVRGDIIGHSNRKMLLAYVGRSSEEMFPGLGILELGKLLHKAREIALAVIDPYADFSTPGFHGVEELFSVISAAAGG